jgi:hypothetical protein
MNSLRFNWPAGLPRLLGSPKECPFCTSIEFTEAEFHPFDRTLFLRQQSTQRIGCNANQKVIARGKVVALQAAALTETDFKPTDELSKIEDYSAPVTVEQKVMAKNKLGGPNPIYPVLAKEQRH